MAPLLLHEQQLLIPSKDRAAILSLRSLVFRLSFLGLGPLVGVAVDQMGNHATFIVLAAFFAVPGTALIVWMARFRWHDSSRAASGRGQ